LPFSLDHRIEKTAYTLDLPTYSKKEDDWQFPDFRLGERNDL
jgi:hypothetical protein